MHNAARTRRSIIPSRGWSAILARLGILPRGLMSSARTDRATEINDFEASFLKFSDKAASTMDSDIFSSHVIDQGTPTYLDVPLNFLVDRYIIHEIFLRECVLSHKHEHIQ